MSARACSALLLLACAATATVARAEPPVIRGTFAADRFTPTPPGDRFGTVQGASVGGEQLFRAALTFEDAVEPLVVRSPSTSPIRDEALLHASIDVALWDRVLFSTSLPFVLVNATHTVEPTAAPGRSVSPHGEPSVGDIEVGLRVRLLSTTDRAFELALGGSFWSTTGRSEDFTGDPSPRGMPYVTVSGGGTTFVYAGEIGTIFERSQDFVDVHLGPQLHLGLAAAWLSRNQRYQVGAEVRSDLPLDAGAGPASARVALEVDGSVRMRIGAVTLGLVSGPGVLRAAGTPLFRGLLSVAYAPEGERDADHDGIVDRVDACPTVAGVPSPDPELHGCPSDRDGDGIRDADDACPDTPGVESQDPKRNGCPAPR